VQCQYRSQHEHPRQARQRRLAPAPAAQGLACFAVERRQAARAVPFPLMLALPGTFDDKASFKQANYPRKTCAYRLRVLRPAFVDRFFQEGFPA
jgi:hypothetical protein